MRHYLTSILLVVTTYFHAHTQTNQDQSPEVGSSFTTDIFSFNQDAIKPFEATLAPSAPLAEGRIPMDYRRFYTLVNNQNNAELLFDNDTSTKYSVGGGLVYKTFEAFYEFADEMNVMATKFRLFDDKHTYLERPLTISIIRRSNAKQMTREYVGTYNGSLYLAWQEIKLASPTDIKYIVFSGGYWDNFPTELQVYGSYTPHTDVVPSMPKQKFKNYFGVNVYEWNLMQDDVLPFVSWQVYEPKWDILKHYTHYRHYLDWGQIEGEEGNYTFQPTRMGSWYYDVFYERMSSGGRTITPCIKALPKWMENTWPVDRIHHENVPVKYPLSYDSVSSYLPVAKTYFQFAARYGSTKVDPSLLSVYSPPGTTPQEKKSGLGYIKVMEAENERDKWWHGIEGYQNGRQYAAFLSAIYDGHMGTMGKNVGIKAADPTMKLIIGGTANPLPDYARGIIDWCKQYRNDSLPFDSFTYHDYATNGSNSFFNGDATRSAAPELSPLGKNADNYLFTVQMFAKNKGRGVINSEFGIDIDPTSPMKAIAIGNRSVLQTQGDWTMRTALLYSRRRFERIYDFQFFDDQENSPGVFGTTGVANADLTKRPVLDYVQQMTTVLGEYQFEETISNKPEVDKYMNGQSVRYVLWMPTETGATAVYNFRLLNPANKVKVYELADGQSEMIQSYAPVSGGVAAIQVTETPKIIEEVVSEVQIAPPSVNAGPDQVVTLPLSKASLSGQGSSGSGSVTYKWALISGPHELNNKLVAPYQQNSSIINLAQGVYVIELKVTDERGRSAADTVAITVNNAPGNQFPVSNSGGDAIIYAPNTSFELDGSASYDPDGKIVKYRWKKVAGPSWGRMTAIEYPKVTVNYAEPGSTYMFDLTVTDDKGASSTDRKVVIVLKSGQTAPVNTNLNKQPIANAGNDMVLPATNSTILNGSKSTAPEGYYISKYTWAKLSGPSSYTITSPGFNASTIGNLTPGVYVFRLTVTDDKGGESTDDVAITVLEQKTGSINLDGGVATPPTAVAGNDEAIPLGQATLLNGEKSTATSGFISAYKWTKVSGPAKYEMLTPGYSTTWIRNMEAGTYVYRLTITDNYGISATDDVQIVVGGGANQLPVAKAAADIRLQLPANSTTLDNAGSYDPDGSITTYKWSYVSGPSAYVLTTPNSASTSVTGLLEGSYVFRLAVTDNAGSVAYDDIMVNVAANTSSPLPVAIASKDETIPVGQATQLRGGNSYAPSGYITSYSWTKISGPAALEMLSPNNDTTWIRNMTSGVYVFQLSVTDSKGNKATDEAVITVTGLTPAPVISTLVADAGRDETIPAGQATTLKGLNSIAQGGTIVKYQWTKLSGPAALEMLTPNQATTWIRHMTAGAYVFRLTVTDNNGKTATDDVVVTVTASAPVLTAVIADAGKDETIPVGQATTLRGLNSTAPGGTIVKYQWTKLSGPLSYEMLTPNDPVTWIRHMTAGVYVFRLTVTDNTGQQATDDAVITVTALTTGVVIADAGKDETIPVGQATTLKGANSSSTGGSIVKYQWTKVAGPTALEMLTPNEATTWIRHMTAGMYVFRLTVTDNAGKQATDDAVIIVTALPTGGLTADAGKDETIPIGQATTLKGVNSVATGGNIVTYLWTKISGPAQYEMLTPNQATTWIRYMTAGSYVYRLSVTDNVGATASDEVQINVTAASMNSGTSGPVTEQPATGLQINQESLLLFPNPVSSQANIKWTGSYYGPATIKVIDATDVAISTVTVSKDQHLFITSMDMGGLKPGVYILEVRMQNGKLLTQKFIKQ